MKKKFLALLLAFVMVAGMLPLTALAEDIAATSPKGTAEQITEEATVNDADPANIVVTVDPSQALKWVGKDQSIGRNSDGWWIGIKIVAPENVVTKTGNDKKTVQFCRDDETAYRDWTGSIIDGTTSEGKSYMQAWGLITPEYLKQAETQSKSLSYKWYFNWDGDETTGVACTTTGTGGSNRTIKGVDQTFTIRFDPKDVVLEKHENDFWPEATIDGKSYSLAGAVTAATAGNTITLADNIALENELAIDKQLTLDLNNKTLSGTAPELDDRVWVKGTGDLTLKNGTLTVTGLQDKYYFGIIVSEGGKLSMDGVTLNAAGGTGIFTRGTVTLNNSNITAVSGVTLSDENAASVEMTGGKITTTGTGAGEGGIFSNGGTAEKRHTIKINSGEIESASYGIAVRDYADVTIADGTVKGTYGVTTNGTDRNTSIAITGGTVTGTDIGIYAPAPVSAAISGGKVTGPVGILSRGCNVTVSDSAIIEATGSESTTGGDDATEIPPSGIVLHKAGGGYAEGSVTINGGTVKATSEKAAVTYIGGTEGDGKFVINGGTFTDKESIAPYIASGKEIADNGDGTFTVKEPTPVTPVTPPSGGGGGTSTTPPVTSDKDSGTTSTTVKPSVKDETASVTVSNSTANALVNKTVQDKTDSAVIEVKPAAGQNVNEVKAEIPAKAVANLASKTDASLTVATPVANVTISNDALADVSKDAKTVAVTAAAKTDESTGETTYEVAVLKDGKSVDELGGELKVALPVDEQSASAGMGLVAVLVDENGNETIITKSVLTEDGKLVMALNSGSATVKYVDNSRSYADEIPSWASDAVQFTSSRQLFMGVSENDFGANTTMNRAMLVTVLHRLEGEPTPTKPAGFQDVSDDSWYAASAAWSAEMGIVAGTENGFDGNRPITRQDLALMLYRYANVYGSGKGSSADFSHMGGADDVADYAAEAMRWAVGSGIIVGDENNNLDPQSPTTRAQVSVMLMRFVELLAAK